MDLRRTPIGRMKPTVDFNPSVLGGIAGMLLDSTADGRDPSILDILHRTLPPDLQRGDVPRRYFAEALQGGRCLVLLDGLDEVPSEREFKAVVRAIESLAMTFDKNQFVVTSRIAGWRGGVDGEFEVLRVNDLSDGQVRAFIDSWYSAVERNAVVGSLDDEGEAARQERERRALKRAGDLKDALEQNEGVRRLAANPMLLSIVALVHRSLVTLPRERAKLYAQCAKLLLDQWDISRGVRVDDTGLSVGQKEAIMRRLAYAYHTGEIGDRQGGRDATRNEVERVIAEILPAFRRAADDAPHLLRRLIERSGLIIERQRDQLQFSHHTFQEYFTAQFLALSERPEDRDLLLQPECLASDWWREVVLLYAGLVGDGSDFLHRVVAVGQDSLCQDRLRLALLCLDEAVAVRDAQVRGALVAALLRVRTEGATTVTKEELPQEAVDYLLRWCRGEEWYRHAAAATARQAAATSYQSAVESAILPGIRDTRASVRHAALRSLPVLPPELWSRTLVLEVLGCLKDKDPEIRVSAVIAAAHLGSTVFVEQIALEFVQLLGDTSPVVRDAVLEAMAGIGHHLVSGERVLSRLEELMDGADAGVRSAFVGALPSLGRCLSDKHIRLFLKSAREAGSFPWYSRLRELAIRSSPDRVVGELDTALDGLGPKEQCTVLRAVHDLEMSTESRTYVVGRLLHLVSHSGVDLSEWRLSVDCLARLRDKGLAPLISSGLLSALMCCDRDAVVRVMMAIARLGPAILNDAITAKIAEAWDSTDGDTRAVAGVAMSVACERGLANRDGVVRRLMQLSRDRNVDVRCASVLSLAVVSRGSLTDRVLDELARALEDGNPAVREFAAHGVQHLRDAAAREDVVDRLLAVVRRSRPALPNVASLAAFCSGRESDVRELVEDWWLSIDPESISSFITWLPVLLPLQQHKRLSDLLDWGVLRRSVYGFETEGALSALRIMASSSHGDRIVISLTDLLADKRADHLLRWASFGTLAAFAARLGPQSLFDRFLDLLRDDHRFSRSLRPLVMGHDPRWVVSPELTAVVGLQVERNPSGAVMYRMGPAAHPLASIARHLSPSLVGPRLRDVVSEGRPDLLLVALDVCRAHGQRVPFELLNTIVDALLRWKEHDHYWVALVARQILVDGGFLAGAESMIKRMLVHDDARVRETAWQLLEERNRALGIWQ